MRSIPTIFISIISIFISTQGLASAFNVGASMYDITGPFAGLVTMGYGAPTPVANGIHQRLRARAFVIADAKNDKRVAYVNIDLCFVTQAMKLAVSAALNEKYPTKFSRDNIMITATHTHSGPGAISHHQFYNIPSEGFSENTFNAIVAGIVQAIERAQANLQPADIFLSQGELKGSTVNRSLPAYMLNSAKERSQYETDTDVSMTNLKVISAAGKELGLLNWFAIHGTSLNKENTYVSGDNKGYAAYLFEKMNGNSYKTTDGFVAVFANSNAGDASPNIDRDVDGDGDWECRENNNFACNERAGQSQFEKALELYKSAGTPLSGEVNFRNQYLDFRNIKVDPRFSGQRGVVTTCPGGLGLSMLAGSAEDGPGVGSEGKNCSGGGVLPRVLCARPVSKCHGEKPVVLSLGTKVPARTPQILPIQLLRIGQLAIIGVPSEFTTMSGRRLRKTVYDVLKDHGVKWVVLAGYANAFSSYTATPEEYQAQHYEGASTYFGRWQLPAFQQSFFNLATAMVKGTQLKSAKPEVVRVTDDAKMERAYDSPQTNFGHILAQPKEKYERGQVVQFRYIGSNPNHNTFIQSSYFAVQHLEGDKWVDVAYDWDNNTFFHWQMQDNARPTHTVTWKTLPQTQAGKYRIYYQGVAKLAANSYKNYKGYSSEFSIQ